MHKYSFSKNYKAGNSGKSLDRIKYYLVESSIFIFKSFIIIGRIGGYVGSRLIVRPARLLMRVLFYQVVVKWYSAYLSFLNRIGWKNVKGSLLGYLFHQKMVHIVLIATSLAFVMNNLFGTGRASASQSNDMSILATLVKSEFEDEDISRLIEEEFDAEEIISPTQQNYLDNLGAVREQSIESLDEENAGDLMDQSALVADGTAVIMPDIASTQKTKRPRTEIARYTVKDGDTISTIAQEFEINVSTILWENGLSVLSIIRPGDSLTIPPMNGVSHEVAKGETLAGLEKKYGISAQSILAYNKLTSEGLKIGQKLFIPGGRKISEAPSPATAKYSGLQAIRDAVKLPLDKLAKGPSVRTGNKMSWPTAGYRISQYYSWRHRGLDIANKTGTPIYAADSETVELAGWGSGYGNQIIINHGGGKKTRYAHLSKFYVSRGEMVKKGENIAAMGSTGRSTGPHLHFELIINGVKYNPLNYIK